MIEKYNLKSAIICLCLCAAMDAMSFITYKSYTIWDGVIDTLAIINVIYTLIKYKKIKK